MRMKCGKVTKMWKLENTLLNKERLKYITKQTRQWFEMEQNECTTPKTCSIQAKEALKELHRYKYIQLKKLIFHINQLEKIVIRQNKACRCNEIINIRTEISETES